MARQIDSRKDERSMQLFVLGSRNAFIFLLFAMPWMAAYIGYGVLAVNAAVALFALWIVALAIAWGSAFYYFHTD